MSEIWKDVYGFDGEYQVSNHGRLRSWKNGGNNRSNKIRKHPRMINGSIDCDGYVSVSLRKNGKTYRTRLHCLVANEFIGCNNGMVVDHIDCDRQNNAVSNLRYMGLVENMRRHDSPRSGHRGVFKRKNGRFYAIKWVNGKNKFIGSFDTAEEADAARKIADKHWKRKETK